MAVDVEEAFLQRYRDELTFLRRMGSKFAKTHPRIARRLELTDGPCPDPHVERLLEGFAFLTARIQHNLEGELPQITSGLLGYIYPHFTQPVPSMAVTQISPDEGGAGLTTGQLVPRETKLFVETSFLARTCRFRTCYPVTLWPLEVQQCRFESPATYDFLKGRMYRHVQSVMRVRLKTNSEAIRLLGPESLRFYINGEANLAGELYGLLTTELAGCVCLPDGRKPTLGDEPKAATVRPVGFEVDEAVLPTHPHALRGYSLLQEYFAFPEKFLFIDVDGLDTEGAEETLDLLFLFKVAPRRRLPVNQNTMALGCTPIINLFDKVSEPIHINGRQHKYLIQPDARWERTTEIHTIRRITDSMLDTDDAGLVEPLYGLGHSAEEDVVYWDARRGPSRFVDMPGTDMEVSFVDGSLRPGLPLETTLRAHLLCTNRDLATHLDRGDMLFIEDGPHAKVELLTRPTPQLTPPLQGEALWKLISTLSLSHLGLPDNDQGAEALRELLRVYSFTTAGAIEPQIRAIEKVTRETVALRADQSKWRGFCRVQRITVLINEDRFDGISPILLGQILHYYFGLHSSVNVFTQVALESRQREGTWKIWPPMIPTVSD